MSTKYQLNTIWLALTMVLSMNANAEDYFLTVKQKQELLVRGQLHDDQQRLYDIWIVPGYAVPLSHVEKGWRNAGKSLEEYGKPRFYDNIGKSANNTWHYGHKNILKDYTFKGTKLAWQQDMTIASQRTEKRVFGWWLAYPWGIFEATTESAFRLLTGIPVGVVVSASAYTVVPALSVTFPVIGSVGYATIEGTTYPLVASVWNTAIAPPLALLGQQPAPQRADGFWMKQVDDPTLQALADALMAWQRKLQGSTVTSESFLIADQKAQIKQLYAQIKELEQQVQQSDQQQQEQQMTQLLLAAQRQKPQLEQSLQAQGLSLAILARNRQALKAKMSILSLTSTELDRFLDVLATESALERGSDDKTDPLQRSLDILHSH